MKDFSIKGAKEIITVLKLSIIDATCKAAIILNTPSFIKFFLNRETDYKGMVDLYKKNSRNGVK